MWALLILLSFIMFFIGGMEFVVSENVLQQVVAGTLLIISAIFFSSGGIIYEIRSLRKESKKRLQAANTHPEPREKL